MTFSFLMQLNFNFVTLRGEKSNYKTFKHENVIYRVFFLNCFNVWVVCLLSLLYHLCHTIFGCNLHLQSVCVASL